MGRRKEERKERGMEGGRKDVNRKETSDKEIDVYSIKNQVASPGYKLIKHTKKSMKDLYNTL